MKKKDNIIRVGDIVRVINPEFFVRCGYPLDFYSAKDIVRQKFSTHIAQFMSEIGFRSAPTNPVFKFYTKEESDNKDYTVEKIISALAYEYVAKKGFGGKEKKIYTNRKEEYLNKEFRVIEKKVRCTGTYYPSSGGYDSWSGDYDYECGGLDGGGTHIILTVEEFVRLNNGEIETIHYGNDLKIERTNVEKVIEKDN